MSILSKIANLNAKEQVANLRFLQYFGINNKRGPTDLPRPTALRVFAQIPDRVSGQAENQQ